MTDISTNGHSNFEQVEAKATSSALMPRGSTAITLQERGQLQRSPVFEQPVILQQSPIWSRVIIWSIVGVTVAAVTWANVFKIEEAIPAQGQLEPRGAVKEVQPPVSGVVKEILIKEGDFVKKDQVLLRLDPKASQSELASSQRIREKLVAENEFYQSQLEGKNLPPRLQTLIQNRQKLLDENQLFQAQLDGVTTSTTLSPGDRDRLLSGLLQANSSVGAATSRVAQLDQQLAQAQIQLEQNKTQLVSAEKTAQLNQEILDKISVVHESGAIAELQFLRQKDEVQTGLAEVSRLRQEEARLQRQINQFTEQISQAQQERSGQGASNRTLMYDRIAENKKRIGEIDSQLGAIDSELKKLIVDNKKQIDEIDNRLNQARLTLKYQEVRAPVDGIIFDLKPRNPGAVVNASEPILQVVPSENLLAKVFITNQDIGFVKKGMEDRRLEGKGGMPVDVRVDSFPFSEFGDIKGTLESIGSDALPPTEVRPFYSFPAKIKLENQKLISPQGVELKLQSGMSINVNIKVRDRTIMSILTSKFTQQLEGIKNIR
jgi:HlyD family secretion protein